MADQDFVRYEEILFPSDEPFKSYSTDNSNNSGAIGPLSLINIFIGTNNSGKSRLLRSLFAHNDFSFTTNRCSANEFNNLITDCITEFKKIFEPIGHIRGSVGDQLIRVTSQHFDELNRTSNFIAVNNPIYKLFEEKLNQCVLNGYTTEPKNGIRQEDAANRASKLPEFTSKYSEELNKLTSSKLVQFKRKLYIPILRGMRPINNSNINSYQDRTIADYFNNSSSRPPAEGKIFTGLELYRILKEKLLGRPEGRKAVKDFEEFLSKNFFNSKPLTLIPVEGDDKVHIQIGKEDQFPIHELGDGLQSLLICIFNIFMEKEPCLFFIEEPDICMHPSLQRSFLEALISHPQHQYFITTHSNHLLDMTLDYSNISVFHFSKTEDTQSRFNIRVMSSPDHNLLRDIGVKNSSVFLTNATIWVEGITDRLYFRAYLNKYLQELGIDSEAYKKLSKLKEDIHFSFVEYQGSTLDHWTFDPEDENIKRIKTSFLCGQAFLIADGDVASKGNRLTTYSDMLGDKFLVLKAKEIENFIPAEILKPTIKKILAKRYPNGEKDFGEKIESINYGKYSKSKTGMGKYLDKLLGEAEFAEKSGTIKSKMSFCKKAVEMMNNPNVEWTLPQELKDICKKVFDHIYEQNKSNLPSS